MSSVRQQINIAVGPRAVWRAFTTEDGVTSWWVDGARLDAKEGGRLVLDTEDEEGEPVQECGIFHVLRPTRSLEIMFDKSPETPWAGSRMKIALARDNGETRVVLVHTGNGENFTDEDRRLALEKEWRGALRSLRGALEG